MKNYLKLIPLFIFIASCGIRRNHKNNVSREFKLQAYRPLENFNGDTLRFVQQSILNRKAYYIGKEFKVLLKDLGIAVKDYAYGANFNKINEVPSLNIAFYKHPIAEQKLARQEDPVVLVIHWKTPLDMSEVTALSRKYKGNWSQELEEYFGSKIVGDVLKVDFKLNKP